MASDRPNHPDHNQISELSSGLHSFDSTCCAVRLSLHHLNDLMIYSHADSLSFRQVAVQSSRSVRSAAGTHRQRDLLAVPVGAKREALGQVEEPP